MVQLGDFSIQLVEAQSKNAFPEYYQDEKTYVEIPNGTKYFISICKPRAKLFSGSVVLRFYVDGVYLGFNLSYVAAAKALFPKYKGELVRVDGISTDAALKYIATKKDTSKTRTNIFSKIKVKVYPVLADANDSKLRYDKDCLLSTTTFYCGTTELLRQIGVISSHGAHRSNDRTETSVDDTTAHSSASSSVDPKIEARQSSSFSYASNEPGRPISICECLSAAPKPAVDPVEQDLSMYRNSSSLQHDSEFDSDSVVFVDPDLNVIAMDDLSGGDDF